MIFFDAGGFFVGLLLLLFGRFVTKAKTGDGDGDNETITFSTRLIGGFVAGSSSSNSNSSSSLATARIEDDVGVMPKGVSAVCAPGTGELDVHVANSGYNRD